MRHVPVEYEKGTKVTVRGAEVTVVHHRVDDQVEIKLPSGATTLVEARDIKTTATR